MPHLEFEKSFWRDGIEFVAGLDEVGRGALAGPVTVGCVVLKKELSGTFLSLIDDSKKLSYKKRACAYQLIKDEALKFSFVSIDQNGVDELGITKAVTKAMLKALSEIKPVGAVLVDAIKLPLSGVEQRSIVKGDLASFSIASASIVAKEERDRFMRSISPLYPNFDFAKNKGYGTKQHLQALGKFGYTKLHRKSYKPISTLYKTAQSEAG